MKTVFVTSLIERFRQKPFIFLTGDLGFNMFEPLRDIMGERFVNCGVAEQNMVGMAAGIAKSGEEVWAYSIAPFLYARCFEQIRNDVCYHNLPVRLVGMGGGFHYGDLGYSHHTLEDYGILLTLPNLRCYVPAFGDDVLPIMDKMTKESGPTYLRLGRCEKPKNATLPPYNDKRELLAGEKGTLISIGSITGKMLSDLSMLNVTDRPRLQVYSELPLASAAHELDRNSIVIEEHVAHGGLASMLRLRGLSAHSKNTNRFGSQQWYREQNGLTSPHVLKTLAETSLAA